MCDWQLVVARWRGLLQQSQADVTRVRIGGANLPRRRDWRFPVALLGEDVVQRQ